MSVLILSVVASIIVALFHIMYDGAKQNILNVWENNVIQLAKSTEYFFARPADAIEFTAAQVEKMMDSGRNADEIGKYLVGEMTNVASLVESNYTGVYGYCRGVYLDASGWVPDADYEPTERPWYIAARKGAGRVTLVSPFVNMQTDDLTMSISKMLSDGKSVLSIDIYMDDILESLDKLAREDGVKSAFILDGKGVVVAHSLRDEIGKNYLLDGDGYEKALAEQARLISLREHYAEAGQKKGEIVFAEKISGGWCAVLVLDEHDLLSSIRYLNGALFLFLAFVVIAWYLVSSRIDRKYREADQLSREVNAVADIYEAMTLVDLLTGQMTVLRSNVYMDRLLAGDHTDYGGRVLKLAAQMSSDEARDMVVQFMDPATYEERLREARSISYDFLSVNRRWVRIQLIVVDRDQKGSLRHIIWAIESIDEEHRQQDRLKMLAETDALSKLRNRRSGEADVRAMLASGVSGWFFLLDIDDFKSINDRFGHDIGDRVIAEAANSIRRSFRSSDIVYRLGGDEFAAFAPGGDEKVIEQRLHREIGRICIPDAPDISVAASVGSSFFRPDGEDSFESLYQRADQRMYQQKREKKRRG